MPVTVMATGSPSGSVTPATDTFTNWRFGGQSTVGLAAAALQSGGRFPGMAVMVVGGRALVVVLVDVLTGAVRYRGLVERSRGGHTSVVRDRFLEICGSGRPHRDLEP